MKEIIIRRECSCNDYGLKFCIRRHADNFKLIKTIL